MQKRRSWLYEFRHLQFQVTYQQTILYIFPRLYKDNDYEQLFTFATWQCYEQCRLPRRIPQGFSSSAYKFYFNKITGFNAKFIDALKTLYKNDRYRVKYYGKNCEVVRRNLSLIQNWNASTILCHSQLLDTNRSMSFHIILLKLPEVMKSYCIYYAVVNILGNMRPWIWVRSS